MIKHVTKRSNSFRAFGPALDSQSCAAFVHLLRKFSHKSITTLSAV
ncbi:hypothetical protein TERTU_4480 [Teredinibacter turnerae T7901]|uniref:Uncharacterized protein n=1 Tax=Teredinibacter turnerae (strain ATCC 39867 / T7901) TaxID=377629 RepID=C5BJ68_TERTT|nr:hypothetical protein TERTU_4480 [Teredinibacter turnerae T7901]